MKNIRINYSQRGCDCVKTRFPNALIRSSKLLIIIAFILSTAIIHTLNAQEDQTLSPYFLVKGQSSDGAFALKSTQADVNIAGVIADVTVTQEYQNNTENPLEAIYVFPASTRAAVYDMKMTIGERVVQAEIMEKGKARQEYEQAKAKGKRASLLEQERPNVFQMNVANIMPGDLIKVELKYTELLVPEDSEYTFVYPTVVGPRYVSAGESGSNQFNANPYTKQGEMPAYEFDLNINLAAGMPIQDILCNTHEVNVNYPSNDNAIVKLDASEKKGGNRDFILSYCLAGKEIESGLLLFEGKKENFFLMCMQPPKRVRPDQIPPREYVFIMDVSGSMNGFPLGVSKELMSNLLQKLRPSDLFNILFFAGGSSWLSPSSLKATDDNITKAIEFMNNQRGGGGTELLSAMKNAYALPRPYDNLSRSMVIITDGYVTVEQEAFEMVRQNLNQANVFAFGIGSSVNRHLIEGLAFTGQGTPFVVTNQEEAPEISKKLIEYIQQPVLTQISTQFEGFEAYDVLPESVPDVLSERPVLLFGKYKGKPAGTITVKGHSGEEVYTKKFRVLNASPSKNNNALKYLWAREKIRMLDDFSGYGQDLDKIAQVTNLGLKYNLMTNYTSFVAIDKKKVRDKSEELVTAKQALPLPQGVPNSAIGFDLGLEEVMAFNGSEVLDGMMVSSTQKTNHFIEISEAQKKNTITFILGTDSKANNPYFEKAGQYFRFSTENKTEWVVDSCKTLEEIKAFLRENHPGDAPWGTINLVVHGNEWTGISLPVNEGASKRTSKNKLAQYNLSPATPPLSDQQIDKNTLVKVYACGLGKDTLLLNQLSIAFGGHDHDRPTVESTPYFVQFLDKNHLTGQVDLHQAEYFYAFFKNGYRPGDIRLSRQLSSRFPDAGIDWRGALSRTSPRFSGDTYQYTIDVPVVWIVTYPNKDLRPTLGTKEAQQTWLNQQTALKQSLEKMDIPEEMFNWHFREIMYETEAGEEVPAIKVIGLSSVVLVLRTIE